MRVLCPRDVRLLRESLPEAPWTEINPEDESDLDDLTRRGLMTRVETVERVEWLTTSRGRLLLAASAEIA